jgi:large subunit ribosomal protein L25
MSRLIVHHFNKRCFSSVTASINVDPSKLVQGVTRERLAQEPELMEYMKANFPEAFAEEGDGALDEIFEIDYDELLGRKPKLKKKKEDVARAKRVEVLYPHNIRPLTSYLRDSEHDEGTRNSRRLRWEGFKPGLLYGGDPNLGIFSHQPESKIFIKTPWKLLQSELDRYHRSFESRVYDLTLLSSPDDDSGGVVHRVTPQNVQWHPVMRDIYCANFIRYHPGRPLKLPIRFINQEESVALKRDGFIVPIQRFVECLVEDGVDIPESIDVDCSGLQVRQVIRLGKLIIPDGVRISERVLKKSVDFIAGIVYGKGLGDDEEEDKKNKDEAKKDKASGQQPAAAAATPKKDADEKAGKTDAKAKK